MEKAELRNIYGVTANEISVDFNGNNFLIIFGRHINGGYFAIVNWGVSGELGQPTDVYYNSHSIGHALDNYDAGKALAEIIAEFD